MSDLGSFAVQSEKLRDHARLWSGRVTDVESADTGIADGVNQGDKFGVLAGSAGVKGYYNTWSAAMAKALEDAATSFRYLDATLTSAANSYDGVDATVTTEFSKLDEMI